MSYEKALRLIKITNFIPVEPRQISAQQLSELLVLSGYDLSIRTIQRDLELLYSAGEFGITQQKVGNGFVWSIAKSWKESSPQSMTLSTAVTLLLSQKILKRTLPKYPADTFSDYFSTAEKLLSHHSKLPYYPVEEKEDCNKNIMFSRLVLAYLKGSSLILEVSNFHSKYQMKTLKYRHAAVKAIEFKQNKPIFWILRTEFDTRPSCYQLNDFKAVSLVSEMTHQQLCQTAINVQVSISPGHLDELKSYLSRDSLHYDVVSNNDEHTIVEIAFECHEDIWKLILAFADKLVITGPNWVNKKLKKRLIMIEGALS